MYWYAKCHFGECHYADCSDAECYYAECRGASQLQQYRKKSFTEFVYRSVTLYRHQNDLK